MSRCPHTFPRSDRQCILDLHVEEVGRHFHAINGATWIEDYDFAHPDEECVRCQQVLDEEYKE